MQYLFGSPELEAVSFTDQLSSVLCQSVHLSVISHFQLLLQNQWDNFNQTWHKAFLGKENPMFRNKEPFNSCKRR